MDMQQPQHPQGYASRRSQGECSAQPLLPGDSSPHRFNLTDSCNQYKESGKSSDSSLSSAHGYRRFNDGSVSGSQHPDNLRLGSLQKHQRGGGGGKDNGA